MNIKHVLFSFCLTCFLTGCGGDSSNAKINSTSSSVQAVNSSSSERSSSLPSSHQPILLSYGDSAMQVGELRLPNVSSDKPFPLVIIIHGGCWISALADFHFMDTFSQAITSLGYATWNIEYRAVGTGGNWPTIFQDVGNAVDYARTLAQNYPVDANNVAVIGHSAGGHLALWAASRTILKNDSELYIENPLAVKGALSLAGIANVAGSHACRTATSDVIGTTIQPPASNLISRLQISSPLQMLPITTKTVLISGSLDDLVPPAMGTEYTDKATALGDNSLHYILQGLDHFDLIDPNKTNWSLYQQSLQEMFNE